MENKQRLLAVIVLLAVAKFIVIPIVEAQNELIDEKVKTIKTNKKMKNMIATGNGLTAQEEAINIALSSLEALIPNYKSEAQAKLAIQQQFEQLASQNNIDIESFTWEKTTDNEQYTYIKNGTVQLIMSAELLNIIKGHDAISALAPSITIQAMTNQLRWRFDKMETVTSRINIDVLFRVGE